MTTDQTNRICEHDSYKINIPEKLLNEKTLAVIKKSLATYLNNKKSQQAFFAIYPYLRDGTAWVAPTLFNEIKEDPECSEIIKSSQTLRYYMKQFAEAGVLLTSNGDGKTAYRLSQEIWWSVLGSSQFKEEIEYQYHHIYIIICIITRILKDLFPLTKVDSIYDLASTLMEICSQLAIADLRERNIPEQTCNGCAYPCQDPDSPLEKEVNDSVIQTPTTTDPTPKKPTKLQDTVQIPPEEHSPLVMEKPPKPPKIPELKATEKDLSIPPKTPPTPPTIPSHPTAPTLPSEINLSLYEYIEKNGGENGIPLTTIVAFFKPRGATHTDIVEILKEGINEGKYYQPAPQKYRIL